MVQISDNHMSIEQGDATYPAESRIPFEDDGRRFWLSSEDVLDIEGQIELAQAVIAIVENDQSWLRESVRAQLTIDDKRRYVELASAMLGRPRLFGWHRHEEIQTRRSSPPNWNELVDDGRLTEVSQRAHIHRYRVIASAQAATGCRGHLQEAVIRGVQQLNSGGSNRVILDLSKLVCTQPLPAQERTGWRDPEACHLRDEVEVRRVDGLTVIICSPGEFGPHTEIVGRIVEYRRRTANHCCGETMLESLAMWFEVQQQPRT